MPTPEQIDWQARYTSLLRQTEFVVRAIEAAVPQRTEGMHPNLLHLYDVARSWRNFISAEAEEVDPGEVAQTWTILQQVELTPGSDTLALLATIESMRLLMCSQRPDYQQRGRQGLIAMVDLVAESLRSSDEGAAEMDSITRQWAPEARRMGIEW